MVESIATRVKRILSASVVDLVDRLETAKAESVMKETIREVEQVIDEARVEMSRAAAKRLQSVRQAQLVREKIDDLAKRARDALTQSREDLAQAAIARQIELEAQLVTLADTERSAANEEQQFERDVAALVARKKEMEESLEAFVAARREAERDCGVAAKPGEKPLDRRAEKSVAAFERAMKTAGDISPMAAVDADTSAKLAELDVVLSQKQISERLAAMKAAM